MSVVLVEVGPRDGLQNEKATIPTDVKVAFINALSNSGLIEIEVSSFVSPKWVPQLADAYEVFQQIKRSPNVIYSALVPNAKGLERALESRVDKIAVFTSASETFNQKNINASIAESIERFREVIANTNLPVRAYISTAFYCPYEGRIEPQQVVNVIQQISELRVDEISLGDTIGKASVDEVEELIELSLGYWPADKTALHFHDTFGNATNNARRGFEMGINRFDSSAGGAGGCPFAPGAPGNVSTENLIKEFAGQTNVDSQAISSAYEIVRPYLRK